MDQEITGITLPTLIVVGADDTIAPTAQAERITARIPDAQLRVIASCGHTSPLERPVTLTTLLDTFLSTVHRS